MNDEAVEALPCERGRTGEKALAARFAGFGRAVSRRLSEANPPQDPKGERDDAAAGAKKRGRRKAPDIRNGGSAKSAKTDEGGLEIDAPRTRSGGFSLHFLPKHGVPWADSSAGSSPRSAPSTTRNESAGAALPRPRSSAGQPSERRRRRLRSRRIERNPAAEIRPPAR